jgi:hypothetical protein
LKVSSYALAEILEVSLRPLSQFQILIPLLVSVSKQRVEVVLNGLSLSLIRLSRGWRGRGDPLLPRRRGWVPCRDRTRGPALFSP